MSITNIPTPYRNHFYRLLAERLSVNGIELEVWFLATTEPGRYWPAPETTKHYERFLWGIHPLIGGRVFHFNPTCLASLINNPPRWTLLSGSWYFPSIFSSLALGRILGITSLIWSESNLEYVEHPGFWADRLRSLVMDSADGYILPGAMALKYVNRYAPSSRDKPHLTLPNVIDDERLLQETTKLRPRYDELRAKWGVRADATMLLTFARLAPIKGLDRFADVFLQNATQGKAQWLVAGEGPLRRVLEMKARQVGRSDDVILVGHRDQSDLDELLAIADAFVLPSVGDPYPLSVLEAMFAGLPLLISDRVGCHPEMMIDEENGLLFNPYKREQMGRALLKLIGASADRKRDWGTRSLQLAKTEFSSKAVVARFVDEVLKNWPVSR